MIDKADLAGGVCGLVGGTGVHGEGGAVQSWVGPPGSVPDLPMPRQAGASPGHGRLNCRMVLAASLRLGLSLG